MDLSVPMDRELQEALAILASSESERPQEIIRRVLLEQARRSRHPHRVEAAAKRPMRRWSGVLDELGRS